MLEILMLENLVSEELNLEFLMPEDFTVYILDSDYHQMVTYYWIHHFYD